MLRRLWWRTCVHSLLEAQVMGPSRILLLVNIHHHSAADLCDEVCTDFNERDKNMAGYCLETSSAPPKRNSKHVATTAGVWTGLQHRRSTTPVLHIWKVMQRVKCYLESPGRWSCLLARRHSEDRGFPPCLGNWRTWPWPGTPPLSSWPASGYTSGWPCGSASAQRETEMNRKEQQENISATASIWLCGKQIKRKKSNILSSNLCQILK